METKVCSDCGKEKDITEFRFRRQRNAPEGFCRDCSRRKDREWYKDNIDLVRKNDLNKIRRQNTIIAIVTFLKSHPCVDCGEQDILVLDFDHQKNNKSSTISNLLRCGYSIDKIKNEIDKCVVRCANCHRRKTAIEGKWFKATLV